MKINILKSAVVCLLTFLVIGVQAQNKKIQADERISEIIPAEKISRYLSQAPDKILHYNFYLNDSYEVTTSIPEGGIDMGSIYTLKRISDQASFSGSLDDFSNNKFNVYKYHLDRDTEHPLYYTLGDSGKYLVFYSRNECDKRLRAYLKSFGY